MSAEVQCLNICMLHAMMAVSPTSCMSSVNSGLCQKVFGVNTSACGLSCFTCKDGAFTYRHLPLMQNSLQRLSIEKKKISPAVESFSRSVARHSLWIWQNQEKFHWLQPSGGKTYKKQQCALKGASLFSEAGWVGGEPKDQPLTSRGGAWQLGLCVMKQAFVPSSQRCFFLHHQLGAQVPRHGHKTLFLYVIVKYKESCYARQTKNNPNKLFLIIFSVLPEGTHLEFFQQQFCFWNMNFSTKRNFLFSCRSQIYPCISIWSPGKHVLPLSYMYPKT